MNLPVALLIVPFMLVCKMENDRNHQNVDQKRRKTDSSYSSRNTDPLSVPIIIIKALICQRHPVSYLRSGPQPVGVVVKPVGVIHPQKLPVGFPNFLLGCSGG
jgi:hypothetical protein